MLIYSHAYDKYQHHGIGKVMMVSKNDTVVILKFGILQSPMHTTAVTAVIGILTGRVNYILRCHCRS